MSEDISYLVYDETADVDVYDSDSYNMSLTAFNKACEEFPDSTMLLEKWEHDGMCRTVLKFRRV